MKILHIMAYGGIGGLEHVVRSLSTGQRRAGHDVTVAAVLPGRADGRPLLDSLWASDVRLVPLPLPSRAYLRERADISRLCVRLKPDVVHTHGYRPDVVDSGVARAHGIPTVTTVHGFTGGSLRNRLYQHLQMNVLRRFDAVVAVSRSVAARLEAAGIPEERIHVLQNAWSDDAPPLDRRMARRGLGVPDDEFLVGWVGRVSREKGADVLLRAIPHLGELSFSVSMIGSGPDEAFLRERLRRHDWGRKVRWHGAIPHAARFFPAFDVFVLSSRTEGTPIVLFEAMDSIVPIISTAVGGVPDVLGHDEAILVPPDDPLSLASAIRSVYRCRGAARARAHAAKERLDRDFDPGPWLAGYEALYRRLRYGSPEAVRPVRMWSST
jgi:glycosyltransferase involved in cell wall biosynthesis